VRNTVLPDGRALSLCLNGGFHIYTHDGVAMGLAAAAPSRRPDDWPGGARFATVNHATIGQQMLSLAPSRPRWKAPDVAAPDDTFVDVTICHPASSSRLRDGGDGRSIVLSALATAEDSKLRHYRAELSAAGPFAPGKGSLVPFVLSDGGLPGPRALALLRLKRWAHCRVGASAGSAASRPYLLNSIRMISTVQQRWNACRVHSAAADLHEQLAAPGAAPVGDVTVASVLRQLGPRAPGLLHVDPREIGLADIDAAGLAPLASLFG